MNTMDAAANIIFRAISAIYEGTISSSTLYPTAFSDDSKKQYTYYGFRLREVVPSRLVVRVYEENKNLFYDLLWFVDDSKMEGKGHAIFDSKSSKISTTGTPKEFVKKLVSDASIKACFEDLESYENFFEFASAGSREMFPEKLQNEAELILNKIPTALYAFSRCKLNAKKLKNEDYQETAINGFLAIIDLIHRSFEILFIIAQETLKSNVFCVRCGQQLPVNSYYCPICGSKQN